MNHRRKLMRSIYAAGSVFDDRLPHKVSRVKPMKANRSGRPSQVRRSHDFGALLPWNFARNHKKLSAALVIGGLILNKNSIESVVTGTDWYKSTAGAGRPDSIASGLSLVDPTFVKKAPTDNAPILSDIGRYTISHLKLDTNGDIGIGVGMVYADETKFNKIIGKNSEGKPLKTPKETTSSVWSSALAKASSDICKADANRIIDTLKRDPSSYVGPGEAITPTSIQNGQNIFTLAPYSAQPDDPKIPNMYIYDDINNRNWSCIKVGK